MAVLIARDGRILLGKRGPGAREPGKWSFPAGFVERGERVERAAAREAREETGLDVLVGDLVGLYSSEGETVVLAVYEATAARGAACWRRPRWRSDGSPSRTCPSSRSRAINASWTSGYPRELGEELAEQRITPRISRYGARVPGDRVRPRG